MKSGERTVRMSIIDEDCEYLVGHVVDSKYYISTYDTF